MKVSEIRFEGTFDTTITKNKVVPNFVDLLNVEVLLLTLYGGNKYTAPP